MAQCEGLFAQPFEESHRSGKSQHPAAAGTDDSFLWPGNRQAFFEIDMQTRKRPGAFVIRRSGRGKSSCLERKAHDVR